MVHFKAHEAFHLGHERAEVVGLLAADIGQSLQENVEVLLAFVVGWGSVACGAFEDVGETASDVVELLFLCLVVSTWVARSLDKGRGTNHANAVRVQRLRGCAGRNLYHFLCKLDWIIQPHATFTLAPYQAVADAHLPGKHM